MRGSRPSITARQVAAERARLAQSRPSTPEGDVEAELRLYHDVSGTLSLPAGGIGGLAERTQAVDTEVAAALGRGVRQVVLLGAGYDGRALRFGGGDRRWFEVDLPESQADKRRRLQRLGTHPGHVHYVEADLEHGDPGRLSAALDAAGHDPVAPSLFVCEGLFVSLTLEATASLCRELQGRAAEGSALVATFLVSPATGGAGRAWRSASDLVGRALGQVRHHDFAPGDPEKLMTVTKWRVVHAASMTSRRSPAPPPWRTSELLLVCEPEAGAGPPSR